jgi:flavodoxin
MISRIVTDIELTVDQRIEIIEKVDQHFDILDFGIKSDFNRETQDEDLHKQIDIMYPGVPRKVTAYYIIEN